MFSGRTVILPNDTSYLIGCDPYHYEAIDRVYAAMGRPDNRPLTMHVATPRIPRVRGRQSAGGPRRKTAASRAGHPAWFASRHSSATSSAAGLQTLAFRVPDDPFSRDLLERCGPIAGTTANPRGGPQYRGDADRSMLPGADLVVEHGPTRYDSESSIVDLSGSHARLLREGAVSEKRLSELLGPIERPIVKVRKLQQ